MSMLNHAVLAALAVALALPFADGFSAPGALGSTARRAAARRAPAARPFGARRLLATATEPARGARRGACGFYPDWPAVPSLEEAVEDPGALLRTLTSQLLSVPTPVMGQRITYDFLANGEVSTGLTRWRESAWAWRNLVGSAFLAPYDELDAEARRAKAEDGLCLIASSTDQVDIVRHMLTGIEALLTGARSRYPKLSAVIKFVPKKNGLNPLLTRLAEGDTNLGLDSLAPREFEHLNRDVRRTFNQLFLLTVTYVTQSRELQSELCWCARIVVERVKTDQRTRALEVLCVGAFAHFSPLRDVVGAVSIREAFETDDGATSVLSSWATDPTLMRAWERMRMVYPFLQLTYLAAQALQPPEHAAAADVDDGQYAAALVRATAALDAAPDRAQPVRGCDAAGGAAWDVEGVPALLRKIGETNPEEKTTNSLLYWLIDLLYNRALATSDALRFERSQFILERPQSREKMFAAVADVGRLVGSLVEVSRALDGTPESGRELLGLTKVFEAHTTLMQSLRDALTQGLLNEELGARVRTLLLDYEALLAVAAEQRVPALPRSLVETAGFGALAILLESPIEVLLARRDEVNAAMLEWRNPELLFRYYQDNFSDPEMAPIVNRWLRAIFATSPETTRDIRRRDPANLRHLSQIDPLVLERWYDKACPGTASMRTLFMIGEDAGSCLRVISTLKNKFNRALMGYCLQSHVRVLVVFDSVKRVLARSLIRLVIRSDSFEPVIYCDALFFHNGYSPDLWRDIARQAEALSEHMKIPVVHAGSTLPTAALHARGGYTREVRQLGYHVHWVDLLEIDGVSPYTYSEDLPWDEMLDQHRPGLQHRTPEQPTIVIAALPRADSPSAAEYVDEIRGRTTWTQVPKEAFAMQGSEASHHIWPSEAPTAAEEAAAS